MPAATVDAVIFDLDGTLLDTLADIARCANAVLVENGYPGRPVADYASRVGYGLVELVRRLLPAQPEAVHASLASRLAEEYRRNPVVSTVPYRGIAPLLRSLAGQPVRLAVLSNKDDELVRAIVGATLDPVFDRVRGLRPGTPRKPDPASTVEMLAELDCPPGRAAFVGDSEVDIETARRAGCVPVGVTWGFRSRDALRDAGAGHIFETAAALHRCLLAWTGGETEREDRWITES